MTLLMRDEGNKETGRTEGYEEGFNLAVNIAKYLIDNPFKSVEKVADIFSCTTKEVSMIHNVINIIEEDYELDEEEIEKLLNM